MLRLTGILLPLVLFSACEARNAPESRAELTVFAASSLTDAFNDLADRFTEQNGGVRPTLAFAGSQILRLQLIEGAEADVFASADAAHVDALVEAGIVVDPQRFAENDLVVIVPMANPASIETFADLAKARRIVIGAPNVPIGVYTRSLLTRAESVLGRDFAERVRANVVSEESNVRLVRAKVELGEADAAIVYRTDVSGSVRTIEVPPEMSVRASYYVGFVGPASKARPARRWVALLRSREGLSILSEHGFSTP
jgi:molybdate transport system substrate-binding protein